MAGKKIEISEIDPLPTVTDGRVVYSSPGPISVRFTHDFKSPKKYVLFNFPVLEGSRWKVFGNMKKITTHWSGYCVNRFGECRQWCTVNLCRSYNYSSWLKSNCCRSCASEFVCCFPDYSVHVFVMKT